LIAFSFQCLFMVYHSTYLATYFTTYTATLIHNLTHNSHPHPYILTHIHPYTRYILTHNFRAIFTGKWDEFFAVQKVDENGAKSSFVELWRKPASDSGANHKWKWDPFVDKLTGTVPFIQPPTSIHFAHFLFSERNQNGISATDLEVGYFSVRSAVGQRNLRRIENTTLIYLIVHEQIACGKKTGPSVPSKVILVSHDLPGYPMQKRTTIRRKFALPCLLTPIPAGFLFPFFFLLFFFFLFLLSLCHSCCCRLPSPFIWGYIPLSICLASSLRITTYPLCSH
jgi:hypothetical protein